MTKRHPDISAEILSFLTKYIDSVEKLEILLLLKSTHTRVWTVTEINSHLLSSVTSIEQRLASLCKDNLIICRDQVYQYNLHPEIDLLLIGLSESYKKHRISVIEFIFSKSNRNLNNFLDAFKLRRDD